MTEIKYELGQMKIKEYVPCRGDVVWVKLQTMCMVRESVSGKLYYVPMKKPDIENVKNAKIDTFLYHATDEKINHPWFIKLRIKLAKFIYPFKKRTP